MAGCFGNDPEDRARERQLAAYLDTQDEPELDEDGEEIVPYEPDFDDFEECPL